ncbi:hypothetical protein THIX_10039 [Thiomonas sp. X19]|nr:hypothetical protein THIX_10039 [Thiomonas sp. X19]
MPCFKALFIELSSCGHFYLVVIERLWIRCLGEFIEAALLRKDSKLNHIHIASKDLTKRSSRARMV